MSEPDLGIRGKFQETALVLPQRMAYEAWAEAGITLQSIQKSHLWWIGDWLAYGEKHFGDRYAQAIEATGHRIEVLRNAQWVASSIPPERRRAELTWSHHREVAGMPLSQVEELLERAITRNLSTRDFHAEVVRVKKQPPVAVPRLSGPLIIEHQPAVAPTPERGTVIDLEPEDSTRVESGGTKALLPEVTRATFAEHHRAWLDANFPDAPESALSEVEAWWWDALGHYGLVKHEAA